jgi:putative spermidine/putrescine transport system permease protein
MTFTTALRGVLFWSFVSAVAVFLLAPTLIAVPISFTEGRTLQFPPTGFSLRWYAEVFESGDWREATLNSLKIATLTTIVSVVLGTSAALALNRFQSGAMTVLNGVLLSPLVIPVVVLSIGMYMVFAEWELVGTITGLLIAHSCLALPFVIVCVSASLKTVDQNLELASAGLGARPWFTFRRVVLPLIAPGVLSGAIFAFITSWDEVVVATFLTDSATRTIPVLIWSQVRTELTPAIAAIGTILIVVSAAGLLLVYRLSRTGTAQ